MALALAGGVAWAGGSGHDEQDDADAGTPFFGFVKDLDARGRYDAVMGADGLFEVEAVR